MEFYSLGDLTVRATAVVGRQNSVGRRDVRGPLVCQSAQNDGNV
jgi:hypothetical protein